MAINVFSVAQLGMAALLLLLDIVGIVVCIRYRRLSRRIDWMTAGLALLGISTLAAAVGPNLIRTLDFGDFGAFQAFFLVNTLLRLVAWALFVGGLAGTLAHLENRMRLPSLPPNLHERFDGGPPARENMPWDQPGEDEHGIRR